VVHSHPDRESGAVIHPSAAIVPHYDRDVIIGASSISYGAKFMTDITQILSKIEDGEPHPEDAIAWTQLRVFDRLLEHRHLLPQCEVLDCQLGFGNEHRSEEQHTRLENALFRTREIRKWVMVSGRLRAVANGASPCQ
jgi:hypothetical protein